MSIVKAIARVRRSAKERGLEGALASLGSELRSDAIPERLRDAAARLATLITPKHGAGQAPNEARAQNVVSLERALEAKTHAIHPVVQGASSHPAEGVCPFTGARATLEQASCPVDTSSARPTAAPVDARRQESVGKARPSAPTEELTLTPTLSSLAEPRAASAPSAPAAPGEPATSPREQTAVEASAARVRKPRPRRSEQHGDVKRHEKNKDGLAGSRSVENTSGRSATRSATQKQPRSRTQASRKKA